MKRAFFVITTQQHLQMMNVPTLSVKVNPIILTPNDNLHIFYSAITIATTFTSPIAAFAKRLLKVGVAQRMKLC